MGRGGGGEIAPQFNDDITTLQPYYRLGPPQHGVLETKTAGNNKPTATGAGAEGVQPKVQPTQAGKLPRGSGTRILGKIS